ncbi:MAG TPA: response regulator transcription factor [Polyangia bacterium]|jgi:DNA-binding NarL/FixJ family response regulator
MANVKVVVVDDHDVLRVGVRDFVSSLPGYEVVGEADSARAAFRMIEATKPDVVLMDIALPGMDGIVATREILRRVPRARVVVLSAHKQTHDVVDAIDAGAVGYVLKADPPETLEHALERAVRGECYVSPVLKGCVSALRPPGKTGDLLDLLSEREREIFRLAADCRTSPEISRELCIARKTVDTHLNRINRKLGLRDRAELVRLAVGIGLVHSIRHRTPSRSNGVGARA